METNTEPETQTAKELRLRKEQTSQRLEQLRLIWWVWLICALIGGLGYAGYSRPVVELSGSDYIHYLLSKFILGSCAGAFAYAYVLIPLRFTVSNRLRRIEIELLKYDSEVLQERIEENFFTKLVQINFKYIDQYYLQTQEQADKSFRLALFASIVGLVVIVSGILMMLFEKTEPAYVTTAAGVLSEFIAAIFFYLYNKTILKMSEYHQKLVITQNISLALKITDDMSEANKAESLKLLVDRLTTDVNKHLTDPGK